MFKKFATLLIILTAAIIFGANGAVAQARGAALCGDVTIGGVSPDFTTISDAVTELNNNGISCPVTFKIRPGTYDEGVVITQFTRLGAADDRVIFQPNIFTNIVNWENSAQDGTNNYIVRLSGADYVTFNNINFNHSGAATHGRIFRLAGGAKNNTINNCELTGILGFADNLGSLIYADGAANEFNTVSSNVLTRGYRGVDFEGTDSSNRADGNSVSNNDSGGQTDGAIYMRFQNNAVVTGNVINDAAWSDSTYTAILADGDSADISRNDIDITVGETGIKLQSIENNVNDRTIANNMVNMRSSNTDAAVVLTTGHVDVIHNTLRVGAAGQLLAGLRVNSGTLNDIHLNNNLFINDGGGYALRAPVGSNIATSDYNNFYTSGSFLIEYDAFPYSSLDSYQSDTGLDANSESVAVTFVSTTPGDLHLSGSSDGDPHLAGNAGVITTDIDGQTRDEYNPTMGADEATSLSPLDNDDVGGFYTVGGASPDFADVTEAILHLNQRGIKGIVGLRIRAGTYTVHETIEDFPRYGGARSANSEVRLRAANPANRPTLEYAPISPSDNWLLKIDGADYIVLRNLDFVNNSLGQWGRIIELQNESDDLEIDGCTFTGVTGTIDPSAALIYNLAGPAADRLHIHDSSFSDGSYGLLLDGIDGGVSTDPIIETSSFSGQAFFSMFVEHNNPTIQNNVIDNSVNAGVGIALGHLFDFALYNNEIQMTGNNATAIQLTGSDGLTTPGKIANNFLVADNGINVTSGASNVLIAHNSVYATGLHALKVDATAGSDIEIKNNILHATAAAGYGLYVGAAADISSSDYNAIRNGNPTDPVIHWDGTDYASLPAFQIFTGLEPHSTNTPVTFVDIASADLHLDSSSIGDIDLAGTPLATVTTDIDGDSRDATFPYIGADEAATEIPLAVTLSHHAAATTNSATLPTIALLLLLTTLLLRRHPQHRETPSRASATT